MKSTAKPWAKGIALRAVISISISLFPLCVPANFDDNTQQNGKFKILKISPAKAPCGDPSKVAFFPGCIIKFGSVPENSTTATESEVYSGKLLCSRKVGEVIEATLQQPRCHLGGLMVLCDDSGKATVSNSTDHTAISCKLFKSFVLGFIERDSKKKTVTFFSYDAGPDGFKIVGSKLEKDYEADNHKYSQATEMSDGRYCQKLSEEKLRIHCIRTVGEVVIERLKTKGDVANCASLYLPGSAVETLARCLGTAAAKFNDMNYCTMYGLEKNVNQALYQCFEIANPTRMSCESVRTPNAKDYCYIKTQACDRVTGANNRDFCWGLHAHEIWKQLSPKRVADSCRSVQNSFYCLQNLSTGLAQAGKSLDAFEIVIDGKEDPGQRLLLLDGILNNISGDNESVARICERIKSRKGEKTPKFCEKI